MLCECGCGQETLQDKYHANKRNRFISGHQSRRPHKNRYISNGRWYIWVPGHSKATSRGFVLEHVILAEKALGRSLPDGVEVHHADGNKSINIGNLVICQSKEYHQLLHVRMRALKSCGNPNWRKCTYCKKYDSSEKLLQWKDSPTSMVHLACKNKYARDYKRRTKLCV